MANRLPTLMLSAPDLEVALAEEELPDLVPVAKPEVAEASVEVAVAEWVAEAVPRIVVLP